MANTIVLFQGIRSGVTYDALELYSLSTGAILNGVSGDTLSQPDASGRPYDYTATVTEAVTGWARAHVVLNGAVVYYGYVHMADDTGTYLIQDAPPIADADVDAVWDEATSGHTTAGTFGKAVSDVLSKWSGITTLAGWLRLMLRSDDAVATDHATELAEINNDEGSGSGDYDNTTDAQEAAGADLSQIIAATEAPLLLQTTVATVTSQTQFTLTDGLATADVYNGLLAVIVDTDTPSTNRARVKVEDYDGATKTVYLEAAPSHTIAVGDAVTVFAAKEFDATGVTISSFEQAALNQLANTDVEIIGIVSAGGGLQLIQGDDYINDELILEERPGENWLDWIEGTVIMLHAIKTGLDGEPTATQKLSVEGEELSPNGSMKRVKFDLEHAVTGIEFGTYHYHARAYIPGDSDWIKDTLRRKEGGLAIVEQYEVEAPTFPTP